MKLERLDLIAFGPFEGRSLDLSAPGLHLVYGPNEAGKSTALRAITGLLFGIPERTGDAHRHSTKALRIGATLQTRDGPLAIVRRKGRKNTLLDPNGDPMDEAPLQRALGGVTQALFEAMFGLNHETLREGAQALLAGHADLGVNLFDAGGARGVGPLLDELRDEAEELFKARGRVQRIPAAIAELAEQRERLKQRITEPRSAVEQREALAAFQAEHEALRRKRDDAQVALAGLQRQIRVLPKLRHRRDLLAELDALGPVPPLPDDAAAQRHDATRLRAEAERDRARLDEEIAERERILAELRPAPALLALDDELLDEIETRLGRHRGAAVDLPKRKGELRALEHEVKAILAELGEGPDVDVEALRVEKRVQVRVDKLRLEQGRIVTDLDHATRQLRQAEEELGALGEMPPAAADPTPLEAVLERARGEGDLDGRWRDRADEATRLAAEGEARGGQLGVEAWRRAPTWPLPARESVALLVERRRDLDEQRGRLEERRRRVSGEIARIDRTITSLREQGALPSDDELGAARSERDELWRRVADAEVEVIYVRDAFEEALARADDTADRLRAEADRVAQFAAQREERARHEAELAQLATEEARLVELGEALAADEEAQWAPLPTTRRGDASALLTWCDAARELQTSVGRWRAAVDERDSLQHRRSAALDDLVAALDTEAEPDARLAPWRDRVEAEAKRRREARARREQDQERRRRVEAAVTTRRDERRRGREAHVAWREAWGEAMGELGLPADASVEEVEAVVDGRRRLFERVADADKLRGRIDGMRRDSEAFEALVRPWLERALPELDAEVGEAAAQLVARARRAREREARCRDVEAERDRRRTELEAAHRSYEAATATLERLRTVAGVATVDELAEVEARVERRADLRRRLAEVERDLDAEGSWRPLEGQEDRDLDRLRVEAAGLEEELEEREEALTELAQKIGGAKVGLERLRDPSLGAHGAAARAQEKLAEIRRLAERWATLRLAERILGREIEAYRQRNQGPIVERASELFPRLTLGEYERLRVDFGSDDEPELRCVGVDGADLGLDGLSDGARDQLYLALRLASLEHYARQTELLPLVADDIFVHFDEDRVAASLAVLDEFCEVGQVLMFTHHHRHVEIAEEVLGEGRLTVHRLVGGHRRAAS